MGFFVLQTKPSQESRAVTELSRQGYEADALLVEVRHIKNGEVTHRLKPYYPSYVFVGADPHWWPIRNTRGVHRILSSASQTPYELADDIIFEIRSRITSMSNVVPLHTIHFEKGQRVKITEGIFAGMEGIFQEDESNRTRCLLELLGSRMKVHVAKTDVIDARTT